MLPAYFACCLLVIWNSRSIWGISSSELHILSKSRRLYLCMQVIKECRFAIVSQVTVGRLEDNTLPVPDTEVSGRHVIIRWDSSERCWQVTDTGSLNGTFLNGKTISTNNRKQGREYRLSSDDMMQLGSYSKVRLAFTCTLLSCNAPGKCAVRAATLQCSLLASNCNILFVLLIASGALAGQ